jgi:hypothetical protein
MNAPAAAATVSATGPWLIVSLKHTHRDDEHITFWRPDRCGYTPVVSRAGDYDLEFARDHNDGVDNIAVPRAVVEAISRGTPYYKPGAKFYDHESPVVDNDRNHWLALGLARLKTARAMRKPEVFKGQRRCIPEAVPVEGGAS